MAFDPYREWLGLNANEQPPTYYQLLGLPEFTADGDQIHKAALGRLAALRKHQAGKHSELSQRLMNEVSQARLCLLDAERKAEYDDALKQKRAAREFQAAIDAEQTGKRRLPWNILIAATSATFLLIFLMVAVLVWYRSTHVATSTPDDKPKEFVFEPKTEPSVEPMPELPIEQLLAVPAGMKLLWSEDFAGPDTGVGICRFGFGDDPLPIAQTRQRLLLTLPPGSQRELYLPMPTGSFRTVLHLSAGTLQMAGVQVRLAAIEREDRLVGVQLEGPSPAEPAALPAETTSDTAVAATPPTGPRATWVNTLSADTNPAENQGGRIIASDEIWLALSSLDTGWQAAAGDTPLSLAPLPLTGNAEPATEMFKPVSIQLLFQNASTEPCTLAVANWRVEGKMPIPQYQQQLRDWPAQPPLPTSEGYAELFHGRYAPIKADAGLLEFRFLERDQIDHWGGQPRPDGFGVRLQPNTAVQPGPLDPVERIRFQCRFQEPLGALALEFADGGSLVLDASKSELRFVTPTGTQVDTYPFQTDRTYTLECRWQNELLAVYILQPTQHKFTGPNTGHHGTLTVRSLGPGPVDIWDWEEWGRYRTSVPIWLATLRGEPTPLTRHAQKPSQLSVEIIRPPAPLTPREVLRQVDTKVEPWTWPDDPTQPLPLHFVNTENDEIDPYVTADGKLLLYSQEVRESNAAESRFEAFFAERERVDGPFTRLGRWAGLPRTGQITSMTMTPDQKYLVFAWKNSVPLPNSAAATSNASPAANPAAASQDAAMNATQSGMNAADANKNSPNAMTPTESDSMSNRPQTPLGLGRGKSPMPKPASATIPELWIAQRDNLFVAFEQWEQINDFGTGSAMSNAMFTPDGAKLYFLKELETGKVLLSAPRLGVSRDFGNPTPEAFEYKNSVQRVTVTASGRQAYLEVLARDGKSMLFKTLKLPGEESWTDPEPLKELARGDGKKGDRAPFVTPDGKFLFFTSDRSGGKGGWDLWVLRLPESYWDRSALKLVDGTPTPASGPRPATGNLNDFLVLGPLPFEPNRKSLSDLRRLVDQRHRNSRPQVGQVDQTHRMNWQRVNTFPPADSSKDQVYLIAVPLIAKEKVEANLKITAAPGGGMFWLSKHWSTVNGDNLWEPDKSVEAKEQILEPRLLYPDKPYHLLGIVCVADPETKLELSIIDTATEKANERILYDWEAIEGPASGK